MERLSKFIDWVRIVWVNSRGQTLSFDDRPYLKEIYEDQFPNIVYIKAAQMGLSERLLAEAVWVCEQLGKNTLYTFPASSQLQDFTQARLDPVFQYSTYLHSVYEESADSVQKIELKKIGKGHLYFRGSQNQKQIISIDADMIVLDERDRFIEANVPFIDKRTLASDLRWRREASTPTLPGKGIHQSYLDSDQRVWQVPCDTCGVYQEIDFFRNIDHKTYECICKQEDCTGKLDRLAVGKWTALNPAKSNEVHGYKITGIHNPKRTIKEIVDEYYKCLNGSISDLEQFYNQTLGMPFQVEGQKLTSENIDTCKRSYPMNTTVQHCYAGCDVGQVNNIEVSIPYGKDKYRVVWAGTVRNFLGPSDSIEYVMNKYDIKILVIDRRPEERKVMELMEKFPGRVYAATYPTKKFTIDNYVMWDDITHEVKLDRTISLDYLVSDIQNQNIEYPENIQFVDNFYDQMTASVRVSAKNEKTGEVIAKWVETGPDHYFHTANYDRIARMKSVAGQALVDYYKEPESAPQTLTQLAQWVKINGRKIF